MSEEKLPKPEEMIASIDFTPPGGDWKKPVTELKEGFYLNATNEKNMKELGLPQPRQWRSQEEDWNLPENWKEIFLDAFKDRLSKYRTLKIFMDVCVRCGACADKCHYFIGGGDPKNMPVLRAELLRSIYRKNFTTSGKLLGGLAGARDLDFATFKELVYYFYQCSECRRCSVYCPYGIDTAEITMMAREMFVECGVTFNWILEAVMKSSSTGNHIGMGPHAFYDSIEGAACEVEDVTGQSIDIPIHKKGAEILFVVPSADYFAEPHIFTLMGYMMLFKYLDIDYTWSAYASEGGNFGLFTSQSYMQKLNAKVYEEAKRLGVKYIIGGECGHMWRVMNQYMDTMNGPADFLETPVSPVTGTVFEHAKSTSMIHICEFTADLIKNNKLKLDPSRNDHWNTTFHDSCNPARAMGFLDEPRYIINNVVNKFTEMPENTIREHTFCCGSGGGLHAEENMEVRLRGGMPRSNAVKYVRDKNDVNIMLCICAIDKAVFPPLFDYWIPGMEVGGIHEMVGNALIFEGEDERTTDLRGTPYATEEEGEKEEGLGDA
jgi:[DsrC]-trisulfide reductase subunit K